MADPNLLYYGDNLDVLRQHVKDDSVDLVYLDPPFKSNQDYNVLFAEHGTKSAAQIKAFEDTWTWDEAASFALWDTIDKNPGPIAEALIAFQKLVPDSDMLAYLAMMAPRLVELHRVLKESGAIYLHCDPAASHYLKLLLDAIFGPRMFRSEIVWKRSSAHSSAKRFSPVHDTILYYSKGDSYTWNTQYQPLPQETIDQWYNNVEPETGRHFNRADLTAAGVRSGPSGSSWRGIDVTAKGRHWAIPGFVGDIVAGKETSDALDALDAAGRLFWPKRAGGVPMLKRYLDEAPGIPALDVVTHIKPLNNVAAERLGYPTQKPEGLLQFFIEASSNEGDLVLDPFCGCGTAVAVAQRLNRRWIGIDVTHVAVGLIKHRLADSHGLAPDKDYAVVGEPTDLDGARQLAAEDPWQFQAWALGLVGARSATSAKKGADKGVDGRAYFRDEAGPPKAIILSVKSGKTGSAHVDQLRGVVEKEGAAIGALITLQEPTKPMRENAASAGMYVSPGWNQPYPRIQLLTVGDILEGKAHLQYPKAAAETFKKAPKVEAEHEQLGIDDEPYGDR